MDHAVGTRYEIAIRQGCFGQYDLNSDACKEKVVEDYENDKISIKPSIQDSDTLVKSTFQVFTIQNKHSNPRVH